MYASIAIRILGASILFLTGVVLARQLGVENYGMYAVIMSAVTMLGIPLNAGLPNLIVRETAKLKSLSAWSELKGLLSFAFRLVLGVLLLYMSTALLLHTVLGIEVELTYVAFACISLAMMGMARIRGGILSGLGRPLLAQLPDAIIAPSVCLSLLITLYLLNGEIGLLHALISYCVGLFIGFIFGSFYVLRELATTLDGKQTKHNTSNWIRALIPLGLLAGTQSVVGNADILLLGAFVTTEAVGHYKVALQGISLMMIAQTGVSAVVGSQLSRAFAADDRKLSVAVSDKSVSIYFGASLLIAVIYYFFAQYFIPLIFGVEYASAYEILMILAVGQLLNAATGPALTLLVMSRNERNAVAAVAFGGIALAIGALTLVPSLGAIGMAVSVSIGVTVSNLLMWFKIRSKLGFDASVIGVVQRWRGRCE